MKVVRTRRRLRLPSTEFGDVFAQVSFEQCKLQAGKCIHRHLSVCIFMKSQCEWRKSKDLGSDMPSVASGVALEGFTAELRGHLYFISLTDSEWPLTHCRGCSAKQAQVDDTKTTNRTNAFCCRSKFENLVGFTKQNESFFRPQDSEAKTRSP